jgi:hypothetical protein
VSWLELERLMCGCVIQYRLFFVGFEIYFRGIGLRLLEKKSENGWIFDDIYMPFGKFQSD